MPRFHAFGRAAMALPVVAAGFLSALPVQGHDAMVGELEIGHSWSRATAPTAPTGAVYVVVENHGAAADRLLGAVGDVADAIELHQSSTDDAGMAQMDPLDGIDIPANGEAALAPGGMHIMLIGLHAPLKEGTSFPLTLTFEHAGTVTVDVEVQSIGSTGPDD